LEFENKVPRISFKFEKGQVTGGWRKLHSEERHNWYCFRNTYRTFESRRTRFAHGEVKNAYKIFVEKSKGNRPLGRNRRR